jgi:mRNA interferase MazF
MNTKQGEVWLADLGIAAKTRPVVVVSRYDANPPRVLVIYVPLTTQYRNSKYEVVLPNLKFLNQSSIAPSLLILKSDRTFSSHSKKRSHLLFSF